MRLFADRERCIGSGMCALNAPEVFDQDDDEGLVTLRTNNLPSEARALVEAAVESCPAGALSVEIADPSAHM